MVVVRSNLTGNTTVLRDAVAEQLTGLLGYSTLGERAIRQVEETRSYRTFVLAFESLFVVIGITFFIIPTGKTVAMTIGIPTEVVTSVVSSVLTALWAGFLADKGTAFMFSFMAHYLNSSNGCYWVWKWLSKAALDFLLGLCFSHSRGISGPCAQRKPFFLHQASAVRALVTFWLDLWNKSRISRSGYWLRTASIFFRSSRVNLPLASRTIACSGSTQSGR
jgi:hypothetical protein